MCRRLYRLRGLRYHAPELIQIDRLGQIIEGAYLERPHGVIGRAIGRDHDAALAALLLLQPLNQLQTLSVGQAHIRDQHGELLTPQQGTRLLQIGRAFDHIATALQRDFIQGAQIRLVINNEHGSASGMGRHG